MLNKCQIHDDSIKRIENKLDTLLGYFQDDNKTKGIFSRVGKLEDHMRTAVKTRWFLFCTVFGLAAKAFLQ